MSTFPTYYVYKITATIERWYVYSVAADRSVKMGPDAPRARLYASLNVATTHARIAGGQAGAGLPCQHCPTVCKGFPWTEPGALAK